MANIKGKDNYEITPTVNGTLVSLVGHNHDHNILTNYVANQHNDHAAISILPGVGIAGGGTIDANRTLSLNVNGLTTDATPDGAADYLVTYDASAATHKRVLLNNRPGAGGGFAFTEQETILTTPASASVWTTRTVTGAPANSMIEMLIVCDSPNTKQSGVRAVGSSLSRIFTLYKENNVRLWVQTNASSQIQLWATQPNQTTFYYIGVFA